MRNVAPGRRIHVPDQSLGWGDVSFIKGQEQLLITRMVALIKKGGVIITSHFKIIRNVPTRAGWGFTSVRVRIATDLGIRKPTGRMSKLRRADIQIGEISPR